VGSSTALAFAFVGEAMKSLVIKRSIIIGRHKTSVSLEDDFWNALRDIAHGRGETLSHLIASIDANRQTANLSSALRVFVLQHYMDQSARQREMFEQHEIPVQ
jgi:predicted DNA-binding ribbon-helix-helix protein